MRVLVVLVGLVATPFLAGVSQQLKTNNGVGHNDAHCAMRANLHPGTTDFNKCPPPTPATGGGGTGGGDTGGTTGGTTGGSTGGTGGGTSGTCVSSPSGTGTASIDGQVFLDAAPSWPGLAGWCVGLSGPVSATAVTDASGNYLFSGLPAGTYTVCETVQSGWHQTFPTSGPPCATGFGWTITVMDGGGASVIWFGNLTP